jgi:hypothetical protein
VKKDVVTLTTTARTKRIFFFIVPSQKKVSLASSSLMMVILFLFSIEEINKIKKISKNEVNFDGYASDDSFDSNGGIIRGKEETVFPATINDNNNKTQQQQPLDGGLKVRLNRKYNTV